MAVHWRDEMSIDGGPIDTDHKFLISLINDFDSEFERGFDQYRILDALKRLEYYTVYHFAREEAIQQSFGFPRQKEHVDQHRRLRMEVKGAISLFSNEIPKSSEGVVKRRVIDLLKNWIIGHIVNYDKEMIPFIRRRGAAKTVKPVKPMQSADQDAPDGYRVPFYEIGKSLAVQVVATERFVGMSFRGRATMVDSMIVAKACEIINGATTSIIVGSLQELRDFDDYFIGHLLSLLGTFSEAGRTPYLVIGSSGPCTEKLKRFGIPQLIRCFPSHSEFYEEIGFES